MVNKCIKKVQEVFAHAGNVLPLMKAGDIVNVHAKVVEKNKERIQQFQGNVIQIQGEKNHLRNITVRMLSAGVYVERIFPVPSPNVVKIEVVRQAKTGRKKRFDLRYTKGDIKTKVKYKI